MKSALLAINIVMLFVSFVAFIAVAVVMPNPSVTAIRFATILFITALVGFLGAIAED